MQIKKKTITIANGKKYQNKIIHFYKHRPDMIIFLRTK